MPTNHREAVIGYLDYLVSEKGLPEDDDEYVLTMLQWQNSDDIKTITALQKKLNVEHRKTFWHNYKIMCLEKPFGCHYEEASLQYGCWIDSVRIEEAWRNNPISTLSIWDIPPETRAETIRSSKMEHVKNLVLTFEAVTPWRDVTMFLTTLAFKGHEIKLNNVSRTPAQVAFFKNKYSINYEIV